MKKILFITKNYPPQNGGMEQYCYDLHSSFSRNTEAYLIANTRGKYYLPIFGIIALVKGVLLAPKVDVIYIGDGSISFIGYILGRLFNKEIYITIHGLDITWKNPLYQKIIPPIVKRYDKIVCVSSHTRDVCISKGIPSMKITVINNGLNFDTLPPPDHTDRKSVLNSLGIEDIEGARILFTLGRFIERKGIHHFLEHVYSNLKEDKYIYIIGSYGPYESVYREIIQRKNLKNVYIVGKLEKSTIANICTISDLFIMPNIQVPGDMEGFGIVAIEAGYYGLPVIASNIEGIKDAVIKDKSGILIDDDKERNTNWIKSISKYRDNTHLTKDNIRQYTISNFSAKNTEKKYLNLIR